MGPFRTLPSSQKFGRDRVDGVVFGNNDRGSGEGNLWWRKVTDVGEAI